MPTGQTQPFIVDANVLIDYLDSDLDALSILSRKVSPVNIGRGAFDKVPRLNDTEAARFHIQIITPTLEIMGEAANKRGSLAYDDHETLLLAKINGWTCITNDKALRRECGTEKVAILWGLEPLRILVTDKFMKAERAITIARTIHANNPMFVTADIIARFESQISQL